jgi:hypothetical protein
MDDINNIFDWIRSTKQDQFKIGFSTITKQAMHSQTGIPQIYHDQMNIIGEHLWDIDHDPQWQETMKEELALPITPAKASRIMKLTRAKMRKDKFWSLLHQLPKWYKVTVMKKIKRKKLTRCFLLQKNDWDNWKKSEKK